MEALFASGHAADIVLAVLAAEAVLLRLRQWDISAILGLLGPAALIVLGLRAALVGAPWYWVSLPVALAFPLHLLDLRNRSRDERN
ncbi:MAG: hypothetical protein CL803_05590 [Citromicrobium sp.]|mgnify:FL=1|nr:hypothetical protein [Citromicrobium sp.]MAO95838.1 hypothetical protein [Citromicrobium sp.]MAS85341.1 hypothetical protein [Erythrobacteraceae bacterium]MBT47072.1 hypothetical protein [Citromicrobium sp.]|tara:strand:+ start:646 stop:903 length:258 start_codon:yes stop_codon:yes gene_type:complete